MKKKMEVQKVGVIGFGLRAECVVHNFKRFQMQAEVVAICDPNKEVVLKRLKTLEIDEETITFYEDYHKMMKEESLDGVMVATNCATHTEITRDIAQYKIPIFVEKPVAITKEQVVELEKCQQEYNPISLVSFPLRATPLCQRAKEIVESGVLGTVSQVQAINNVPYARVYYHSWYRDDSLTGGLFLQKTTHDIDVIQYLLEDVPTVVSAMESKVIYKGEKPIGITCPECEEYLTCPESSHTIKNGCLEGVDGEGCCFAKDTGNHDSATMLMEFSNGVHGFYTQNFIARKSAGKRLYRIIGYLATLEFDFTTGVIQVFHHMKNEVDTITVCTDGLNHFGGDKALAENFVEIMQGTGTSLAPLRTGIESAKSCLMAKESATTKTFVSRTM